MTFLLLFCVILAALFGLVVLVGPPYLPTMKEQTEAALDLLDLKPGETLLELGSGDGRVMLAAAKRGLKVVGIELNPVLVVFSLLITWRYRRQVRVIWGSYWGKPWPHANAIFTFMLTKYMSRLDKRIKKWRSGPTQLASFAFKVPGRMPVREKAGVYLYEYK